MVVMDDRFSEAAATILAGDVDRLASLLGTHPALATATSSSGHPTLLQLVASEAARLPSSLEAARLLVEAGAATTSPLIAAAGCDARSVLEYLLGAGADVDGAEDWTPLDEALYWDNRETAELLVARGARVRALSTAAGLGEPAGLAGFLDHGRPTPAAGPIGSPFPGTVPGHLRHDPASLLDHAFVTAVNCARRATAQVLLEAGAEVNARPPGFHWKGTALHAAARRGDRELVEWLLAAGADPAARDGLVHQHAAGWASHHGHPELVPLLTTR